MYIVFILLKAPVTAKLQQLSGNIWNVQEKFSFLYSDYKFYCVSPFCLSPLISVSGFSGRETGGRELADQFGGACLGTPLPTWVSGTMGFCAGAALKKVDSGEAMMMGSGRRKPLRSQLGMEFSSVFITRVSVA